MKKNKSIISRLLNALEAIGFMGILKLIWIKMRIYFLKKKNLPTHSQLFEDYFLDKFLGRKSDGFYVDVGANDPFSLNNTAYFYAKGWHGINIEPDAEKFSLLCRHRPRDLNIRMGVGKEHKTLKFYRFGNSALCTFSQEEAKKRISQGETLVGEDEVQVDTLAEILKNNIVPGKKIDIISVDAEGLNWDVLSSSDWIKYRPSFVCVEVAEYCNSLLTKDKEIAGFLRSHGYREVFFNGINSIFKDSKNNKSQI